MRVRASLFAVFAVAFAFVAFADPVKVRVHQADGLDDVDSVVSLAGVAGEETCAQNANTICLANNRFRLRATYTLNGTTGNAGAVRLTGDTGYFWFFSNSNVEAVIKVLDGCPVNNRFWVFAGGLTDQQATITVTDMLTGATKQYTNPAGTKFAPIQDTDAFSTCSAQPPCEYALGSSSLSAGASGTNSSVAVFAPNGCPWTAVSNASWLTILGNTSGSGNGTVDFAVAPNPSTSARSGTMTIADHTFLVNQSGSAPPNPYDGSWAGSTSQAKAISFTIANNAISTITFAYHGTGSCTIDGETTVTYTPPRPISGNSFTLSGSGTLNYTIHGTFTSPNTASGDLSFTFNNPFPPCTASGFASWNANK